LHVVTTNAVVATDGSLTPYDGVDNLQAIQVAAGL